MQLDPKSTLRKTRAKKKRKRCDRSPSGRTAWSVRALPAHVKRISRCAVGGRGVSAVASKRSRLWTARCAVTRNRSRSTELRSIRSRCLLAKGGPAQRPWRAFETGVAPGDDTRAVPALKMYTAFSRRSMSLIYPSPLSLYRETPFPQERGRMTRVTLAADTDRSVIVLHRCSTSTWLV